MIGNTALMEASARGHAEVVQLLVDYRANTDFKNSDGDTALLMASANGDIVVAMLVGNGDTDMDLPNNNGTTALMMKASENGHAELAQQLLEYGASLNLQDHQGATALMKASAAGHAEVVEILLGKPSCTFD